MDIELFRGSKAKEVSEYRKTVLIIIKEIENRPKRAKGNSQAEYSPRSDMHYL
jgi:hypothetical protein